jgi:hypothetical protein
MTNGAGVLRKNGGKFVGVEKAPGSANSGYTCMITVRST